MTDLTFAQASPSITVHCYVILPLSYQLCQNSCIPTALWYLLLKLHLGFLFLNGHYEQTSLSKYTCFFCFVFLFYKTSIYNKGVFFFILSYLWRYRWLKSQHHGKREFWQGQFMVSFVLWKGLDSSPLLTARSQIAR